MLTLVLVIDRVCDQRLGYTFDFRQISLTYVPPLFSDLCAVLGFSPTPAQFKKERFYQPSLHDCETSGSLFSLDL